MKKVINGKMYNTDSAKFLTKWCSSNPVNDFAYSEESLFVKRTGEYFLYGHGGPMTKYKVYESTNTWTGGEKIIPLSVEEAKKWTEKSCDSETYEEIFGSVNE